VEINQGYTYDARSTNHQDLIFNLFDNVCVLYVYAHSM